MPLSSRTPVRFAAMWPVLLVIIGVLLSVVAPNQASAQVIFIDSDAIKNAIKPLTLETPAHLSVVVIRYLPEGKAARHPGPLPTNCTLPQIVETLSKKGQVNLLFYGERDLSGPTNATVRFNSTECRPAFSLDPETNQSLTNRDFGLRLEITAHTTPDQQTQLDWDGNFSWSPNLIDAWAGEKYLMFGMRVAKLIKPGSVYSEDDDGEDGGQGINIGSFFKRKRKEPKEAKATLDISFIEIERRNIDLKGHSMLSPGNLSISITPSPSADPDQPEFIYLIQQLATSN